MNNQPQDIGDQVPEQDDILETSVISSSIAAVQQYGWFIVVGILCVLYYRKSIQAKWQDMKRKRDEDIYAKKYDAGTAQSRQEAMEAARRRMQEEHAGAAAAWQSQQAEKEMVKRQEKIEDWEKHTQGLGYRSKIKKNDEKASPSQPPPKSTKSKPLRNNDYSPLAGAAGPACQITFGRRGGGSRGGGG